jgi:hypothetical protein
MKLFEHIQPSFSAWRWACRHRAATMADTDPAQTRRDECQAITTAAWLPSGKVAPDQQRKTVTAGAGRSGKLRRSPCVRV